MQLPNAPHADGFPLIEAALQSERVARYLSAAGNDKALAFDYYLWNCLLSECFLLPLHFSEIVCRNALHRALLARGNAQWFEDRIFLELLDPRFRSELTDAVRMERGQHRAKFINHHVVSALTFGFWEHLATKRFERYLWSKGIHHVFPNAPKKGTHEDLRNLIESVRRWRNRIAHHQAIFDKGPMKKHQEALDLIRWVCDDTATWVASNSKVPAAISLRPGRR